MKNFCKRAFMVLSFILIYSIGFAQPNISYKSLSDKIPSDPNIIIGKLDNGMVYYIKENHKPEKRADLYLATKVGSVLEDEDQKGLAHFCEHMAFNGTKDFPKADIVNFLESIGVRFGADLNAFTSFDQTVYTLQLPTDKKDQFEKGFDILSDWSHNVAFDDVEIDKERGVVMEEWRLGKGADDRVEKKHMKYILYNSRYEQRDVIGDTTVLLRCSHDALRRFYKDWYRPDLMAVIAVGDFDKFEVEKKIKEHFGGLTNPAKERERVWYKMPPHKETFVSIQTDKELSTPNVQLYFKLPGRSEGDYSDYKQNIAANIFSTMLNNRLKEYTRKPNPPFMFSFANESRFLGDERAFMMIAAGSKDVNSAMETLFTEAFRVMQTGFTKTEFERAKKEALRNMEQTLAEKDKTESRNYAMECMRNFQDGESMPGIATEVALYKKFMPEISLDEVNALAKKFVKKENSVICISAPEKPDVKVPTEKEVMASFDKISNSKLEPYVDNVSDSPLMSKKLTPGTVTKENKIPEIGVTEWTLSNGVKVVFKPTDFKNDEILFNAYSPGGLSLVEDKDFLSASLADRVINESGIGSMNATALEKLLTGKVVDVSPTISQLQEGFRGKSAPEDMETMFQLIYLYFTDAKVDNDAFKATISMMKEQIQNSKNSPEGVFSDSLTVVSTNRHFRTRPWTEEMLAQVDPDKIFDIYYDRFADASDFTFFFVGNIDVNKFKNMVLTYLANLPSKNRKETWKDVNITYPKGKVVTEVKKGIEKKASVRLVFSNSFDWSLENRFKLDAMMEVLNIRLREVLREDKGGVYGVGAFARPSLYPKQENKVYIVFGCNPDRVEELISAVMDQIKEIKENLPTDSNVTKVKEIQTREREVQLKENNFWVNALNTYYWNGDDPKLILKKQQFINKIDGKQIQETAKKYLIMDNYMKFVLYPEK